MALQNPFLMRSAAERYHAGRPALHSQVVARLPELTGCPRFGRVLDVGCGTGQSTQALAAIADHVTGIDVSTEMLAQARPVSNITYLQASAESLPFPVATFDLLTAGLAFHWFDQEQFLREARRVLRPHGWLAVYNIAFRGVLVEHPDFAAWYRNAFLRRFPNPPRNTRPITAEGMAAHGFQLTAQDVWSSAVTFTPAQFVNYLLSQSNVTVAVEQTDLTFEQVEAWIGSETAAWFGIEPVTADFQIDLSLLRPSTSP